MLAPLREDFFLNFEGFHGTPSRAHIRLVHDEGKPMVVVCSQPLYGAGTSVQNAFEIIREEIWPKVEGRISYPYKQPMAAELDSLKAAIQNNGKVTSGLAVWAIEKLSTWLCRDTYHRTFLRPNLKVVWLEHWPPGTCSMLGPPDHYLLVRENGKGAPAWIRVDLARLAEELGYPLSEIKKAEAIFQSDPLQPRSRNA